MDSCVHNMSWCLTSLGEITSPPLSQTEREFLIIWMQFSNKLQCILNELGVLDEIEIESIGTRKLYGVPSKIVFNIPNRWKFSHRNVNFLSIFQIIWWHTQILNINVGTYHIVAKPIYCIVDDLWSSHVVCVDFLTNVRITNCCNKIWRNGKT